MNNGSHESQPVAGDIPDRRTTHPVDVPSEDSTLTSRVKPKPSINWFAALAGMVSFGSVCLILLGFGVSLAVERRFGLPHAAVFDSTFELMDLASIAAVELIPSVMRDVFNGSLPLILYKVLGPVVASIAVLFGVLTLIGWLYEPSKNRTQHLVGATALDRWVGGLTPQRYLWRNALIGLAILLYPLLSLIGVIAFLLLAAVVAIVPILGMDAGNAYIDKWVIAPEKCRPPASAVQPSETLDINALRQATATRFAKCVALKKDKEWLASGRVVLYTSHAVVLLDSMGKIKKFPTSGVTVEVTDVLQ